MKKILPLLLVAVMFLTAIPIVYAEDADTYKVGDIIQFGSYPQSEVKDEALIAELNAFAPEWEDWTSYGYYSGNDDYGSMVQGDWMKYVDVTYNNLKYRGVKFTQYRPAITFSVPSYNDQSNNGYSIETVYWFKFELLDWRILDPSTGFVICEKIVDSQAFSNTIYRGNVELGDDDWYNDFLCENYANDYETSSIRKWLNKDFYNTAFAAHEKKEINTTTLNNDGYNTIVGNIGFEKYDSKETEDKIFLLSYAELRNNNYWLNPENHDGYGDDPETSDYAACQGSGKIGEWLLRTPGGRSSTCCFAGIDTQWDVWLTRIGTRPALHLNDISKFHRHIYNLIVTNPTCTDKGYTTHTCECGDTYIDDYVYENGHTFTNYTSVGNATCIAEGEFVAKCDYCDATDSIIDKGEHKFSDSFTIDTYPTCTNEGSKSRHCSNCSEKTDVTPIGKLAHTYNVTTINPTCTDKGYNVYTCNCSDSYTETIEATGHSYEGSVCTICAHDKAEECSCNCHAGGIKAFFFRLINFFQKLFGKNKVCECGVAH